MHNTRRVREPTHAAQNAVKPGCQNDISESSLKRVLSVEAVIDDMRAILWPDCCGQESSKEIEFVSGARARE